ncbi:RING-H2 finger protein ATL29-like [Herrania umbratica]|uniref:RING-type E3 ubiquitin transferase n=1 Tax=Herrania umbratica TaxID=108875 RepID=A0A6J1B803_9ROSI|nr:RING-H2 finger protein ATL29-like [Herrania umbratica]
MSTYSPYAQSPSSNYNPPVPIIVAIIFVLLFFFGFFAIYFFRCLVHNLVALWNRRRNPSGAVVGTSGANMSNGLDPELIQAFPTFSYSSVKEFRCEKYGLECAICLGEFSDEDMLRLLTICCHVFHKECVDLWLESHKTCPVCRGELDVPRKSLEKSPILVQSNSMHEIGANQSSVQDAVCIDIKEDNNEEVDGGEAEAQASSNTEEQHHKERDKMERFSRSHSTGHSIVRTTEEEDRYTPKLLDHVKIKIVRGHKSAGSCIAFGDFSSPLDYKNGSFGEASETGREDMDKI